MVLSPVFRTALFASILVTSVASCAQKAAPAAVAYRSSAEIDTREMAKDILYYVNEYRASLGLPALQILSEASDQATRHSIEMANHVTAFGHDGFDERINNISKKIGIVHASAENVAYGKLTARQVVNLWLHSPGHKQNIEGNYFLTGIGVAKDKTGVVYYTQIFLRK